MARCPDTERQIAQRTGKSDAGRVSQGGFKPILHAKDATDLQILTKLGQVRRLCLGGKLGGRSLLMSFFAELGNVKIVTSEEERMDVEVTE